MSEEENEPCQFYGTYYQEIRSKHKPTLNPRHNPPAKILHCTHPKSQHKIELLTKSFGGEKLKCAGDLEKCPLMQGENPPYYDV